MNIITDKAALLIDNQTFTILISNSMESLGEMELKNLIINELTLGKDLAKQLQIHLNVPVSSRETLELLIQRILNSYDKALNLLIRSNGATAATTETPAAAAGMSESPRSLSGSPTRSEDSDREFHRDQHDNRDTPRRRYVPYVT